MIRIKYMGSNMFILGGRNLSSHYANSKSKIKHAYVRVYICTHITTYICGNRYKYKYKYKDECKYKYEYKYKYIHIYVCVCIYR